MRMLRGREDRSSRKELRYRGMVVGGERGRNVKGEEARSV